LLDYGVIDIGHQNCYKQYCTVDIGQQILKLVLLGTKPHYKIVKLLILVVNLVGTCEIQLMLAIKLFGSFEVVTNGTKDLAKDWMWMT
jgi:hypothetical protein